jgi:hypothetical protein
MVPLSLRASANEVPGCDARYQGTPDSRIAALFELPQPDSPLTVLPCAYLLPIAPDSPIAALFELPQP